MANMRDDEEDGALDQRAMLEQLRGGGNTGVLGNAAEVAATRGMAAPELQAGDSYAQPEMAAPPAPKQTYNLEGYDADKLASDHDSAKYQIGRTIQNYDPRQGITPEVLAALNALGIGTFSGERDKLSVTGGSHGLQGDTNLDVVRGYGDPNTAWQYGVESDDMTRAGGAKPALATSVGMPQTATNSISVPTDASFFNDLIARMRAGAGNDVIDQSALLNQLR